MLALITLAASVPTAASAAATGTLIGAGIDWELAFKALGLLATIAGSVIQLRNFKLSSHAGLKTELEILKLLDESDAHYKTVKKSVDLRVARLYAVHDGASAKLSIERIVLFVFGAAWALGFAYWTIRLSSPVFSWWSLATGYAVLLGLVWLGMGVTGKGLSHRKASAQQGASGTEAQSPDAESSRTDA